MGRLPGSEYHKREAEMAACHETEEERDLAQVPLFVFILLHLTSAKEYPPGAATPGGFALVSQSTLAISPLAIIIIAHLGEKIKIPNGVF